MLLKCMGSICILLGAYAYGYGTGLEYKRHITELESLSQIIWQINGEISYTKAPLTEVFERVSRRVAEPYRTWLCRLSEEMNARGQRSFGILWREVTERELKNLILKKEEKEELSHLGEQMGYLDIRMQEAALSLYGKRLEEKRAALLDGLQERRKVAACLGIAGGIFLVLILV